MIPPTAGRIRGRSDLQLAKLGRRAQIEQLYAKSGREGTAPWTCLPIIRPW